MLRPLLNRPYLLTALAAGAILYVASAAWIARPITRALIGWDGGVLLFLAFALFFMRKVDIAQIKERAARLDEGGHLIFLLTIVAAIASVGALLAELSIAKGATDAALRVALAAGTVLLSWLFVQVVFALHYAHIYYLEEAAGQPTGGLDFGQCGEPDYWDFVHFALVLGATAQTADIGFTTKRMRRIGTLHTLVAFGFNTAILATMINLAAALF